MDFAMRILMILTSLFSYWLNGKISEARYGKEKIFDFEKPLTSLIWLTSLTSIAVTFGISYVMLSNISPDLWWRLSLIISCGTLAAALIPEFTKSLRLPSRSTCRKLSSPAARRALR